MVEECHTLSESSLPHYYNSRDGSLVDKKVY